MRVALAGAATKVGGEVVLRLKEAGHHVIAFDKSNPDEAVDQWIRMELGDPASISAATAQAQGNFDALVNAEELPPLKGDAKQTLAANFLGVRQFLHEMTDKLSPGASVVNVSARAGWKWRENVEQVRAILAIESVEELSDFIKEHKIDALRAYNLSREAIVALTMAETETLHPRDIRINSISPGAIATEFLDDFIQAYGDPIERNYDRAGRMGQPGEVADVIVWLLSPQSSWVKGEDIMLDGGIGAMINTDTFGLRDADVAEQGFLEIATSRSVVLRAVRIAAIVGFALAALNHGDRIVSAGIDPSMLLKIAVTFLVPFCVSTYSSVVAVRGKLQKIEPPLS